MNYAETGIFQQQKIRVKNLLPEIGIEKAREEIIAGLISGEKHISSKFFYDKTGSELFEEITTLPEYYPTRTEKIILKTIASDLMNKNFPFEIMELGSGDCSKISILLDAVTNESLADLTYIPVDVSRPAILESAKQLSRKFAWLPIEGFVADFTFQLNLIPHSDKPRLICFFGSTIGNFNYNDSKNIIQKLADNLSGEDSLLVGFDLLKDESVLHAAYNDSQGVTEKFNINILNVVNSIIESDFNTEDFESLSFFNTEKSRNEMHLVAKRNCTIQSPFLEIPVSFEKGDSIHTENSHKYSITAIEKLIKNSGLKILNVYTDPKDWFALVRFGK